jgi:diguanylate cyclase (GGDEF)-like protein
VEAPVVERQPELETDRIEQKIEALDWRDLQLWGIGLVVLAVVAIGLLALIAPQMLWHISAIVARQQDIAQLIFGLTALLILLNVYLFQQRLILLRTRRQLILQLQIAERGARTDALTGVFNRRFMEEALTREVARAERNQCKLCVMLADVDEFKNFNTRFGHLSGDRILVEVTTLLQKNFRAADLVIRYGGDEFLVIMPDTDLAQAELTVARLRQSLDRWNDREQREYRLGLSCGLAAYKPGITIEHFLKAADSDLYVQKARRETAQGDSKSPNFTQPASADLSRLTLTSSSTSDCARLPRK